MNTKEKIQNALDSLNNMQRATPGPFFYTRLSARLLREPVTTWEKLSHLISRPSVAIGAICLIISINMAVVLNQADESNITSETPELALADEYAIATTSFYDYENGEAK